jgi:hypothetical protein
MSCLVWRHFCARLAVTPWQALSRQEFWSLTHSALQAAIFWAFVIVDCASFNSGAAFALSAPEAPLNANKAIIIVADFNIFIPVSPKIMTRT